MIDVEQHLAATKIAAGCPVESLPGSISAKAEAYGRMAAMLSLEGVSLCDRVREDLLCASDSSIGGLMGTIGISLSDHCFAALRASPHRTRINDLFNERRVHRGNDPSPAEALGRISSGIDTAVFALGVTLRTIRYRTLRTNERLSGAGLYASHVVPSRLSMKLGGNLPGGAPCHGLTETPDDLERYDTSGPVFKQTACSLSLRDGLRLMADPIYTPESDEDPHIGCLFMLIKGAMPNLWTAVADASVERGIIQVNS
ncbi:MAG TPA: hypothetical protein VLE99_02705 [Candidatus Saccharimonadales bacterium]|nr:hypothetical protein [Candidatus Saccharimonadales bacterium]